MAEQAVAASRAVIRRGDGIVALLSGFSTLVSFASMALVAFGVGAEGRRQLLLLAPLSLFQAVLESGAIFEYRSGERRILAGMIGRLAVCSIIFISAVALAVFHPDHTTIFLALVALKALYVLAVTSTGSLLRDITLERKARALVSITSLASSLICVAAAQLRGSVLDLRVWVYIQMVLLAAAVAGFLLHSGQGSGTSSVLAAWRGIHTRFTRDEIRGWACTQGANYLASLAGLTLYAAWPVLFSIRPGLPLERGYGAFGLLYVGLSIALPVLNAKLLQGHFTIPGPSAYRYYLMASALVLAAAALSPLAQLVPAVGAGLASIAAAIMLTVNEVYAAVVYPIHIFGRTRRSLLYSFAIAFSVVAGFCAAMVFNGSFADYIVACTLCLVGSQGLLRRELLEEPA